MATFLSNEDGTELGEQLLEIEQDGEWVNTNLPQPDPKWQATDSNGHLHTYVEGADHYPTLRQMTNTYWCSDCDDEHVNTWYLCRICEVRVNPGTFVDSNPFWVGGPTVYRLNGKQITAEEARAISEGYAQQQRSEQERTARTSQQVVRAEQAMRAEGMSEEQIRRVVDSMVA